MNLADSTQFKSFDELAHSLGRTGYDSKLPVVCVQGLGFVGLAMAAAVASARDEQGQPRFNVIGVDLPTPEGKTKIDAINAGKLPIDCTDDKLAHALLKANKSGNLIATSDPAAFALAAVTVVDIPLDVSYRNGQPTVEYNGFRKAIRTLAERMRPGSLIIVETTVPPGTTEKIIAPELAAVLEQRGQPADAILLAHSYERVMPGNAYFDSIVNYWRVYAGLTDEAANACEQFLSTVINVKDYPLRRLHSPTASETAKVLENSYRATTIAFMEEWGRFAEAVGVDLFQVVNAIRDRPTHSNIRQPGFGVGGYCLTKDPLFAAVAARELYGHQELSFPFCTQAVEINNAMPRVTIEKVKALLDGDLRNKRILLLGVSYRQDVGDTRYSPSEIFVREAMQYGAKVLCHDPLVSYWPEMEIAVLRELPVANEIDAIVFAVPHRQYAELDLQAWLGGKRPILFDANNVLTEAQRETARRLGCEVGSIGRGAGL